MAKKGMKTKADMDNHANQLNPNNKRYKPKKQNRRRQKQQDENYDDDYADVFMKQWTLS